MFRSRLLLVFLCIGAVAAAGWLAWESRGWRGGVTSRKADRVRAPGLADREKALAEWGSYDKARTVCEGRRAALAARWKRARPAERPAILKEAAAALTDSVAGVLSPFWYGTRWDFNGITETPGEGRVACGYFVSTMMKHAGLGVERVRMAQQASENIIRTLTGAPHLYKGHGLSIADFVTLVRGLGPGLSVVGLDKHVGLLWHDGAEVWFLHSTVAEVGEVIKERALDSRTLASSKYRIVGAITDDARLLEAWLDGRALPTWKPPPPASATSATR